MKARRFETDRERKHLRDMFSQYSDAELEAILQEIERLLRWRDSSRCQPLGRSPADSV